MEPAVVSNRSVRVEKMMRRSSAGGEHRPMDGNREGVLAPHRIIRSTSRRNMGVKTDELRASSCHDTRKPRSQHSEPRRQHSAPRRQHSAPRRQNSEPRRQGSDPRLHNSSSRSCRKSEEDKRISTSSSSKQRNSQQRGLERDSSKTKLALQKLSLGDLNGSQNSSQKMDLDQGKESDQSSKIKFALHRLSNQLNREDSERFNLAVEACVDGPIDDDDLSELEPSDCSSTTSTDGVDEFGDDDSCAFEVKFDNESNAFHQDQEQRKSSSSQERKARPTARDSLKKDARDWSRVSDNSKSDSRRANQGDELRVSAHSHSRRSRVSRN